MTNPLKQIHKQMKDQERKQRTENFAVLVTGFSFIGILLIVIIMSIATSCSSSEKTTIYGNQNSHCDP